MWYARLYKMSTPLKRFKNRPEPLKYMFGYVIEKPLNNSSKTIKNVPSIHSKLNIDMNDQGFEKKEKENK